jgi:Tol biopolymer transport system component
MKYRAIYVGILLSILFVFISHAQQDDFPVLKGPYLGQKPPGIIPEIFAPGIVSTGMHEAALVFSPDGKSMFFNIMHLTHGFTAIVFVEQKNGQWTKPQVASFSGKFNDSDAFFSYDSQKLFFTSDRPSENEGEAGNLDIWVVEREKTGWSEPKNLGTVINSEDVDVNPCVTRNGTLYFASNRAGGQGSHDIYRSLLKNGKYSEPENLGDSINTSNFESSPFVSPDESYIIFNRYAQKEGEIRSGLHISFKNSDGSWRKAINMGNVINDLKPAMFAFVSYDGRYLFFTNTKVPYLPYTGKALTYDEIVKMFNSPQNGTGDIYWVDAKIIEDLKPKQLK